MRSRRATTFQRRIAATLTLALALGTTAAYANPTAVERETARTLLLSGREKKKNGNLKGALSDFEKAHRIMGVPTTALDLGKAQRDLGLLVEARTSFLEAVQYAERPNEPQAFTRARREAKGLAEELAPRLGSVTIEASSGATVKMDDKELSPSSLGVALKVNPGKHELVATLNGEEQRKSVDVSEGSRSIPVSFVFANAPPGPAAGKTDAAGAGQDEEAHASDKPVTKTNPLVWVGVGTAAVGVGVGVVTGIMAFGVKSDVSSRCEGGTQCPPSEWPNIDRGQQLATVSTIAFVVGGAGLGVMIYGLLNPSRRPASAAHATQGLRLYPSVSGVSGTF